MYLVVLLSRIVRILPQNLVLKGSEWRYMREENGLCCVTNGRGERGSSEGDGRGEGPRVSPRRRERVRRRRRAGSAVRQARLLP